MNNSWLNYLNLSDAYERKARFIPGVLTGLPLIPVSMAYEWPLEAGFEYILAGLGMGAIISVGISHLASAFGNRFQKLLWPDWPHDSPTNQWLHPDDPTVSAPQKERWYKAIKRVVGLDIKSSIKNQDIIQIKAIINDAVKALRERLWNAPEGERLRLYNLDYGFARNISGLRPIWLTISLASFIGCWIGYIWYGKLLLWCIVSTLIMFLSFLLGYAVLPSYVRQKAIYYAESFFGALIKCAEMK